MINIHQAAQATALSMCLVLAGCATPVSVPKASVAAPDGWNIERPAASVAPGKPADAWWQDFGSAELNALIESALLANRDLHIAAARVAQARALVDGANAEYMPQFGLAAGARKGRESSADPKTEFAYGGLRASWELDPFGGKDFTSSAARSDAEGADLAWQAARMTIAAEVATAYFDILTLRQRDAIERDAIATLEWQIAVAQRRFAVGQVSRLDIDRFSGELHQGKANASQLRGQQQVRLRQLALLLGASQQPTLVLSAADRAEMGVPPHLLPAELLERRPDVQRQARALDAAAARLGIARRDLYPRFLLDWAGRKERMSVAGSSAAPAVVIGFGLSVSLPLFDGGRIHANIDIHEARMQEAMAEYEKAMLSALADAGIALTQLVTANASSSELEAATTHAAEAARRSQRLFDAGQVDLNTVLDTYRSQLRSQDALLQGQGAQRSAAISVRRAFAGSI